MPSVAIYGDSGMGKTMIMEKFRLVRRDNQDENRATIRMRMRRRGITKEGRSPTVEIPAAAASAQVASSGGNGGGDKNLPSLWRGPPVLPGDTAPIVR